MGETCYIVDRLVVLGLSWSSVAFDVLSCGVNFLGYETVKTRTFDQSQGLKKSDSNEKHHKHQRSTPGKKRFSICLLPANHPSLLAILLFNPFITAYFISNSLVVIVMSVGFGVYAVAVWAVLFVSSVSGFTGGFLPQPGASTTRSTSRSSSNLFVSTTLAVEETDSMMQASFGNDSLMQANQLAGNILPEQELLGHAQQARGTRQEQTPSPVELEQQQQRKTKISASVKETGYDSINHYMVRCFSDGRGVCFYYCFMAKSFEFSYTARKLHRNPCAIMNSSTRTRKSFWHEKSKSCSNTRLRVKSWKKT